MVLLIYCGSSKDYWKDSICRIGICNLTLLLGHRRDERFNRC